MGRRAGNSSAPQHSHGMRAKASCFSRAPRPVSEESTEMSYMMLIVEPYGQRRSRTPEEGRDLYQRMLDYAGKLKGEGVLIATQSLREPAVRLELRAGKPRVI